MDDSTRCVFAIGHAPSYGSLILDFPLQLALGRRATSDSPIYLLETVHVTFLMPKLDRSRNMPLGAVSVYSRKTNIVGNEDIHALVPGSLSPY